MIRQANFTRVAGARHARVALACLVLLMAAPALAQSGAGYDLSWSTIEGGGLTLSSGGAYALGGTAGQADAGSMSGGSYTLAGGFWPGAVAQAHFELFLPLVLRGY